MGVVTVGHWIVGAWESLQGAARGLLRRPSFAVIAVGTLALGIGATTAAFSVLDALLLRPLPYPDSDRLVAVVLSAPRINVATMPSAPFLHFTYVEQSRTFQDVGLWRGQSMTVMGESGAQRASAVVASYGLMTTLGVEPQLGRLFSAEDDLPDSPPTVLLTHRYWQTELGGSTTVIGQTLLVDGQSRVIIGVLPRTFRFLNEEVDFFVPYQFDRSRAWLGGFGFQSVARLKPDVRLEEAAGDVERMIAIAIASTPPPEGSSREAWADRLGLRPNLEWLEDEVVGGIRRTLWLLMGAISLVWIIALANVANLLLVRAEGRQVELGVRGALGAGRLRLMRDLMVEGVVMGATAGVVGLAAAYFGLPALLAMAPDAMPRSGDIAIDARGVIFAVALSLINGVLLGLVSVGWQGRQPELALGGGGRWATPGRRSQRVVSALVVVQVAFSIVLLIGSGLMVRTYLKLSDVDPGFDAPGHVQTARLSIPASSVSDPGEVARMQDAILRRVADLPSVTSAGYASTVPMDGTENAEEGLIIEGRAYSDEAAPALRRFEFISPGFFATLGTDLVAGRDLTPLDVEARRPVALVSETLARQEWRTPRDAIGQRIRGGPDEPWREVIGVVQDVLDEGPHVPARATAYFPAVMSDFWGDATFVTRDIVLVARGADVGTEAFVRSLRQAVSGVDPDLPLTPIRLLSELQAQTLARHAFVLALLATTGVIAFFMGIVGLYGVLAYAASRRRREIGLRMALGAEPGPLTAVLMRRGVTLAVIGVLIGVSVASLTTRFLSSLLFRTSPVDVATYVTVSVALVLTAAWASYQPARRATRVSPVIAMRPE